MSATTAVLIWSGIGPRDRFTWCLEVAPVVAAMILLAATYRRFRLTSLSYWAIAIHAVILCVGGHWTYAEAPPGEWVRRAFDLQRNHYDRLGHFAQGFIPAIVAREVFLRTSPLRRGGWLFFFVAATCLAISASFEFVEWGVALAVGADSDAYLATQGDPWDTQWDMFLALCGAVTAQGLLSGAQDSQLRERGLI